MWKSEIWEQYLRLQKGAMLFIAPAQLMGSEDDGKLHQLRDGFML